MRCTQNKNTKKYITEYKRGLSNNDRLKQRSTIDNHDDYDAVRCILMELLCLGHFAVKIILIFINKFLCIFEVTTFSHIF